MVRRERTRTNNPTMMRARILDAAADLFLSRGYHATSTQDVTTKAGVTSGALHHHFPTKKALGLAVIEERVADTVRTTWIEPFEAAESAVVGARLVFQSISDSLREQGYVRGCPLNNLALELSYADPDFREPMRRIFEMWRDRLAQRLRDDQARGWQPDLDPAMTANLIISTYAGAMTMAKVEQTPAPLEAAIASLAERLADR